MRSPEVEVHGLAVVQQPQGSRQQVAARRSCVQGLRPRQRPKPCDRRAPTRDTTSRRAAVAPWTRPRTCSRRRRSSCACGSRPSIASTASTASRIEGVVREDALPLEHISEIKIVHVDGLSGAPARAGDGIGGAGASVPNQVMSSALEYRLQTPLVESLLDAAGLPSHQPGSILKPRRSPASKRTTRGDLGNRCGKRLLQSWAKRKHNCGHAKYCSGAQERDQPRLA